MKPQTTSKKWVDYSDSDSPSDSDQKQQPQHSTPHHPKPQKLPENPPLISYRPSKKEVNAQLKLLDELNHDRIDQVWLDLFSQNLDYLENEMDRLASKAKKGGNIVKVQPTDKPEAFEAKVYINVAYDFIEFGYDKEDRIRATVSPVNFKKETERGERQKEVRREEKNEDPYKGKQQKKKYVDKLTGKPAEISKKEEPEREERKYTKEEAEKTGESLAGFRNKPNTTQKTRDRETLNEQKEVEHQLSRQVEPQRQQQKPQQQQRPLFKQKKQKLQFKQKEPKQKELPKQKKENKQGKNKEKNISKGSKIKSQNPFDGILDL